MQRWEKEEGLPVHRQMHKSLGTVYAYESELDGWWQNGRHRFGPLEVAAVEEPRAESVSTVAPGTERAPRRFRNLRLGLGAAVIVIAGIYTFLALRRPLPLPISMGYTQLTDDGQAKGGPLFTDASRLYFIEGTDTGALRLVSVSTAGGTPTPIAVPFTDFTLLDICPRRSDLMLGTPTPGGQQDALWTLPLPGGTPRRLGNLLAWAAAWSPGGARIAYSNGRDLYIANSDGSDSHKIASLPAKIEALTWSPDRKKLRLVVEVPGSEGHGFWDVKVDGTRLHRVLPEWEWIGPGEWTPDGRYFLFLAAPKSAGKSAIWAWREGRTLFQRAPSAPIQLAPAGPLDVGPPTLSPEGKEIFVMGEEFRPELERYDSKSGEFTSYLGGIAAAWVSFSRDKRWVAYLKPSERTLWRAHADGSEAVQRTFPPLEGEGLEWSPDGKQIALRARYPGRPWRIYLIPAAGGAPEPMFSGTEDQGIPSWSPDSKKIVFGDVPPVFGHDNGHYGIHVYNLETHSLTDLPGSKGLWTARWSPDGRYVAALTITSQELRVFDFVSHRWRALPGILVDNPTWSRDGKYLYFDGVEPARAIYRVRVSDAKLERIAGLEGIERNFWWGCGVAPDDSLIITVQAGFREIYALNWQAP